MFRKKGSLRDRLLAVFLSFVGMIGFVALVNWWFYQKSDALNSFNYRVEGLMVDVFALNKLEQDFFSFEIYTPQFHKSQKSQFIQQHQLIAQRTQNEIEDLLKNPLTLELYSNNKPFQEDLINIKDTLKAYVDAFDKIVQLTLQRGFIDYGLEGEMRNVIHQIEATSISQIDLLTLRRYEKDYLNRKDTAYVAKFIKTHKTIITKIENDKSINATQREKIKALLQDYQNHFVKLVHLESIIGLNRFNSKVSGKRGLINRLSANLVASIERLLKETNQNIDLLKKNHYHSFVLVSITMVLAGLLISYVLAKRITAPIENLTQIIERNMKNRFENPIELAKTGSTKEVVRLNQNFNQMLLELREQLQQIKENNHELNQQNEELNANNTKLQDSEERLCKLNNLKDKFLSIISHDLRAPLNTIIGFMRILETDYQAFTETEIHTFASETQKSVARLVNLLDNLLQWSLSETEDIKFNPTTLDIAQLAADNLALYEVTAREKNLQLILHAPPTLEAYADANMVNFIFRNLLSNAIKFSQHEKQIKIEIYPSQDNKKVEIKVIDQGIGIPSQDLHKVFNREEHFSTTGTSREKGTGFGLLLCKNFVERQGGEISLESQEGTGTTVSFNLPTP